MAVRTPGSTTVGGTQQRTQYHAYWGRFAYTAYPGALPTAGAPGRSADQGSFVLPGAAGNLPVPAKLEAGDVAYTEDASGFNRGFWTCISTGGADSSDGFAVWVRDDNVGLDQTIRDAHMIVVTHQGALPGGYSPSDPPNDALLDLDPQLAGVAADFVDPGDGTVLSTALAVAGIIAASVAGPLSLAPPPPGSAALLQGGCDVRLRMCRLDFNLAPGLVTPLIVPTNVRLIGAGRAISSIRGKTGAAIAQDQRVFDMRDLTWLEGMFVYSPAPTGAVIPSSGGVIGSTATAGGPGEGHQKIRDVAVISEVDDTGTFARSCVRNFGFGTGFASDADGVQIIDCISLWATPGFAGPASGYSAGTTTPANSPLVHVEFNSTDGDGGPCVVRNNELSGGDRGVYSHIPKTHVWENEITEVNESGVEVVGDIPGVPEYKDIHVSDNRIELTDFFTVTGPTKKVKVRLAASDANGTPAMLDPIVTDNSGEVPSIALPSGAVASVRGVDLDFGGGISGTCDRASVGDNALRVAAASAAGYTGYRLGAGTTNCRVIANGHGNYFLGVDDTLGGVGNEVGHNT